MPIELFHTIIQCEVRGPSASFGYRKMQRHLRSRCKLNAPRDNTMNILREVDPEGIKTCRLRKLCRRKYIFPMPDHCWSMDGYDKLNLLGLPIHREIDGISKRIFGTRAWEFWKNSWKSKSLNFPGNPEVFAISFILICTDLSVSILVLTHEIKSSEKVRIIF